MDLSIHLGNTPSAKSSGAIDYVLQSAAVRWHLLCKTMAECIISASHMFSHMVGHTDGNKYVFVLPRNAGK